MGAASYVTGSHNLRFGTAFTNGDWRLVEAYTGDVQPITYSFGRPVSVTLRLPNDMSNGIKRDFGLFMQDRWAMGRVSLNLGVRYDNFVGETRESSVLPNRFTFSELANGVTYGACADGRPVATATARSRTGRTFRHASALRGTCLAPAVPP